MPRHCSVCLHQDNQAIDRAVIAGEPYRVVARRYAVSEDALQRHKKHIPPVLAKAHEAELVCSADSIFEDLRFLGAHAQELLEKAKSGGDTRSALFAIRERVRIVELRYKISLETDAKPSDIVRDPRWIELRDCVLDAIQPCEGCTGRVLRALEAHQSSRPQLGTSHEPRDRSRTF